jgi:hypothetical protein
MNSCSSQKPTNQRDDLPLMTFASVLFTSFRSISVGQALAAPQANPSAETSLLELEIDEHDNRLYALTPDEIKIVEEASK